MKIYNKQTIKLGLALALSACSLTNDLDDFEPQNVRLAETVVQNQESAEQALTGVYANLLEGAVNASPFPASLLIPEKMGFVPTLFPGTNDPFDLGIITNNPLPEGNQLSNAYAGLYNFINRANWVIFNIEQNTTDAMFSPTTRRTEIIAEARALRALGHFNLLRLFGQFYNTSSEFGVDVRTEPVMDSSPSARESVSEVYQAIHQDLDFAIASAPDLRAKFYVSKMFARGLKARVLLYEKRYIEAAAMADAIITDADPHFGLAPTFDELWNWTDGSVFTSVEALLNVHTTANRPSTFNIFGPTSLNPDFLLMARTGSLSVSTGTGSTLIQYDISRMASLVFFNTFWRKDSQDFIFGGTEETVYLLRMAEIYLIYAEAAARADGSTVSTMALDRLNAIRLRAGADPVATSGFAIYPPTITHDEFLAAVRIEKLMELSGEAGETWFDLVRYDEVDGFGTGFQVSDIKATATNADKFILPIPTTSINASNGLVVQNPSY